MFAQYASQSDLIGDPIDQLLNLSNNCVLAPAGDKGGEYDSYRNFTRRDIKRLVAARLISSANGVDADILADICASNGARQMNGDECAAWWIEQCLIGLDLRASVRNGGTQWHELEQSEEDYLDSLVPVVSPWDAPTGTAFTAPSDDPPAWIHDWLARTVHGPKLDFLLELLAWAWYGGDEPATPSAPWGAKCRARFDARRGVKS